MSTTPKKVGLVRFPVQPAKVPAGLELHKEYAVFRNTLEDALQGQLHQLYARPYTTVFLTECSPTSTLLETIEGKKIRTPYKTIMFIFNEEDLRKAREIFDATLPTDTSSLMNTVTEWMGELYINDNGHVGNDDIKIRGRNPRKLVEHPKSQEFIFNIRIGNFSETFAWGWVPISGVGHKG